MNDSGDDIVPYQQSVDMQKKIIEVTGKQTAELITFEDASYGDAVIETKENVANDLNFIDKIYSTETIHTETLITLTSKLQSRFKVFGEVTG